MSMCDRILVCFRQCVQISKLVDQKSIHVLVDCEEIAIGELQISLQSRMTAFTSRRTRCSKMNNCTWGWKDRTTPSLISRLATFFREIAASSSVMSSNRMRSKALTSTGRVQHPPQHPWHIPALYFGHVEGRSMSTVRLQLGKRADSK